MVIMNQYAEIVAQAIRMIFSVEVEVKLSRPEPKFGDYATNAALQIAKQVGQNPREVAEQIAEKLRENGEFSEVAIAGPGFINLRIAAVKLNDDLTAQFNSGATFGENDDGAGKAAVVEYPSPNMAKPYSVGHLRSGNQGWAARNLLRATGWRVITDNHLGDSGSPFGYWVVGFERFSSEEKLSTGGIYELGRCYVEVRSALKEEEARGETTIADEAQQWLIRLEQGDSEAVELSERFNKISLEHIHNVMNRLGISTDYEYGERFFVPFGKKSVQDLLSKGIATQNDDGSVIIDLTEQGIDTPILIQKSNGAALYATTDLATILWREENWHPDKVVYCVGVEQKFYFEQLAALAKKLGIDTELYHLWYGMIDQMTEDGKREKMSSRKGVVLMEELLDEAEKTARANSKSDDMADEDIKKIAVGAIKFTDFASDRRTGMLFDWSTMFSLTGFSGPYVQYAAVRVNKILRDNGRENPTDSSSREHSSRLSSQSSSLTRSPSSRVSRDDESVEQTTANTYDYEAEKALLLKLTEYPEVVAMAARELEPHRVATYVYELARELNRYYEQTPVATSEVPENIKSARLNVLKKTAQVFEHGLGILGIEIPNRM